MVENEKIYPWIEERINGKWRVHWDADEEFVDYDSRDEAQYNIDEELYVTSLDPKVVDDYIDSMSDVEADADTLKSAGMGTDEDYTGGVENEDRF